MLPGIKQFDLTGRAAIVTGGSKGLGQAMAEGLASAGCDLVLTSRHANEAEAAAELIRRDYDRRAIGVAANVTSKGAVATMTKSLALELAPFGITCNAICPGPFLTPMNVPIAETEQAKRDIVGATALNRWGRLEEIQGAAIYLASNASSFTTGSLLVVDGGWTAR